MPTFWPAILPNMTKHSSAALTNSNKNGRERQASRLSAHRLNRRPRNRGSRSRLPPPLQQYNRAGSIATDDDSMIEDEIRDTTTSLETTSAIERRCFVPVPDFCECSIAGAYRGTSLVGRWDFCTVFTILSVPHGQYPNYRLRFQSPRTRRLLRRQTARLHDTLVYTADPTHRDQWHHTVGRVPQVGSPQHRKLL